MSDSVTYNILHFRTISEVRHSQVPARMTMQEVPIDAWVLVATVSTDRPQWLVLEDWFNGQEDSEKQGGRYRLERPAQGYAGGHFEEYVIEPSWTVKSADVAVVEVEVAS